ncbi:alpha/beta hydrolase [Streptomyces tremellae]|uniref:Alpha/beta fold hydrolase n=1 Tax=Streptomyces tremellae TaxID=1124239 RepID=A0ABP7EW24_9ACTN
MTGTYATVNGLRTYYEDHPATSREQESGTPAPPMLLLHGGGVTADSWSVHLPALTAQHRVLVPERRGHGRTQDLPGPFTYRTMAEDTAALIDHLGTGPVHAVGWSDGGVVALHLALHRPDLVRTLTVIGTSTDEGVEASTQALFTDSEENRQLLSAMFQAPYAALSPDGPGHFPVVLGKLTDMWRQGPELALNDLKDIPTPTLVAIGDHDEVTVGHADAMARALPQAQLAVVPGTTHALPLEKPHLVGELVLGFVSAPVMPGPDFG